MFSSPRNRRWASAAVDVAGAAPIIPAAIMSCIGEAATGSAVDQLGQQGLSHLS